MPTHFSRRTFGRLYADAGLARIVRSRQHWSPVLRNQKRATGHRATKGYLELPFCLFPSLAILVAPPPHRGDRAICKRVAVVPHTC